MTFRQLGLIAPILSALDDQGYLQPSPIQEKAIPPALLGRDVLGCAQTGTGKTCAFATPILQRLNASPAPNHAIRALILTPTRELAIQIGENIEAYGKNLPLRTAVIFGGVGQGPQVEQLRRGVDILVATPGRLGDLYQQKLLDLSKIEIFVLDEADRMLDMGFIHDVKKILKWLPKQKQTMLFSATMPQEISDLVNSLLHDPARVAVNPVSSTVDAIQQTVYFVDKSNKTRLLAHLIKTLDVKNALVFTRTKHGANKVARDLVKAGISAAAIHGNKSQTARQQALYDFKIGNVRCLVATDIAARGLDIEELSHVFNYNLSEVPETYVHRIGRTGRAGRGGEAIAFCDFGEKPLLKEIEKLTGRAVTVVENHPFPMQVFEAPKRDKQGRIINEEDAEARAAARESRRVRDEANKAAAREKRKAEQAKTEQAIQALEERAAAPEKTGRKQKKKAVPQIQEPQTPVSAPSENAQPASSRKKHRNKRKQEPSAVEPVSSVSTQEPVQPAQRRHKLTRPGTRMETGSALPQTNFHRPDPLSGDQIMDATARLLAPRASSFSSVSSQFRTEPRQRKKKAPSVQQPAPETNTPATQDTAPKKSKKGKRKKPAPVAQHVNPPAPKKVQEAGPAPKKKKQRAPKGPMEPMKSGQTKDSTEQKSLMKPYYINF